MRPETRKCKNCENDFTIEVEDFAFYEKIKVSPPTWCRECRQMRRMSFRNERILFKRKDDRTGKDMISIFSPDSPHKVYDHEYWWDGGFNPMDYGRDFDFSKTFFDQFKDFLEEIPWPSLRIESCENSEYNNDVGKSKNLYLCARTHSCSNVLYSYRANSSRDCADCMQVFEDSEFLYECIECISCTNSSYLYFCENCANSDMLWNCKNCLDCFMCTNLRNKQYCYKNLQLTREEYQKKIAEFNSGSFAQKEEALKEFEEIKLKTIRRNLNLVSCVNSSGDNLVDCKNCFLSFGAKNAENSRYLWDNGPYKDCMDSYSGGRNCELVYECTATSASYNCKFCNRANECRDAEYSIFIKNSGNLFGCIGLHNKEYCILNKQYSETEYKKLKEKIIEHMRQSGEYGEFFPMKLSNFAYNETVAQEYFPKNKEGAEKQGLRWRDPEEKDYKPTVPSGSIPDEIKFINSEILKETFGCVHEGKCAHGCTKAFKIIERELEFYKMRNLALPRLCPNCRHYERLAKLNPQKLWPRECMCAGGESTNRIYKNTISHQLHGVNPCGKKFETSFSPDRKEIVYCEDCYKQEIY